MDHGLPFEWIVAARFLREGRMQTALILAGIAIGVAVIVFMSALLTALQANFIRRVLTAQSHIQLLPPKEVARVLTRPTVAVAGVRSDAIVQAPLQRLKSIDQWQSVAAQIQAMPDVVLVTPATSGSALVVRGDASRAITLVGVDPAVYFRIVAVPEKIVRGTPRLTNTDILIGTDLATDLGVTVGDKLRVSTASGSDNTLTVTGLFDLGNKSANERITYVAQRTAQSLLGMIGGVSSIEVTVEDVYAAEAIARRITSATGVEADSWIATNAQFFTAVQAQKTSNTTIRFFVGLSVAFGIASVLVVSVVQKSREIGILRAMGISRGQVLRVFLLQGGLLGLMGSVGGCSIGLVALWLWQRYARNPDGTPFFPVEIEPALFIASMLLATLTGLAAAFAPALRAARLDPVVAIRG
jgi:lipoprotein-releasing system permease protein